MEGAMDALNDPLGPAELDEAGARADLAAHGRRSIRALAQAWGWSPSRVFRFLERLEAETASETPQHESETADLFRETEDDPAASPSRDTHPEGRFNWAPENEDVLVAGSPPLAIYVNRWGQIVLRSDSYAGPGAGCGMDEQVIYLNPCDVYIIIDRLETLAKELLSGREGPSK
jgi:hypothetical protein